MERIVPIFGLFFIVFICWLLSENRRAFPYKTVVVGMVLQFVFALLVLKTQAGRLFFELSNDFVNRLLSFSDEGAKMLFGEGFKEHFFAFSVLPTIIFVSALMSILFYAGIMQKIVQAMSYTMVKLMDASGSESLASAANVFIGQTEAPLVIKPYLASMTRSELMCLMVGGMANVAGGVMAAYVGFGMDAGHLLACSVMSAPAGVLLAKVLIPETDRSVTKGEVSLKIEKVGENVLDAACLGAADGLKLAANVAAMLIAFVSLIAMFNYSLVFLPDVGGLPLTFERIMGWLFSPFAFIIGVPMSESLQVGALLGKKIFVNEFMAYLDLKELKGVLSERSFVISTYALCGFANFSSIAIQIGGIGVMIPDRRKELAQLGVKAMIGGAFSTMMTASVAAILL
jgi:CNT family concentrative nucleoside transporter